MADHQTKYLEEAGQRLRRQSFTFCSEYAGLLSIEKDAHQFCRINLHGGVIYDPDHVRRNGLEGALEQVRRIADETLAYMRQMEQAPLLQAEGLTGDYRLLAEFNDTVLAGHQTRFGVQFITWQRVHDRSLWQGHYFDPSSGADAFAAAKRDFATRSGLLSSGALFTPEQLAEVYRCIHETLDSPYTITDEREKCLRSAAEQIEDTVPDLAERVEMSNQAELLADMESPAGGTMQVY